MVLTQKVRSTSRAGFTLMEVLVVVAILVILAGVASVAVFSHLEQARLDEAKLKISKIESAVMAWKTRNGDFPADLTVLTQPIGTIPASLEVRDLQDPWGQLFVIDPSNLSATGKPLIYSSGPPGAGTVISNHD